MNTTAGRTDANAADPAPLLTPLPENPPAPPDGPNRGSIPDTSGGDVTPDGMLPDWSLWEWVGHSSSIVVALLLTAVAVTTIWWMLHAWHSRDSLQRTGFSHTPRPAAQSFSLLVPGRHEEEVMGQTLDKLAEQDHPDFEIIAIVGHDDPGTEAVARAAAARHPGLISVVVDSSVPQNRPKALNLALETARGSVIGVFDAEDDVHPRLLSLVDSRFTETGADVVQGGVQPMDVGSTWWSLHDVLEYYFRFRSRLHSHADAGFVPLGGSTVFIRRVWLDWSEGWDTECLAEDCEVGVRFSGQGARVAVAYSPEVVTRKETPGTLGSLLEQRTRRNQGFLQVLGRGGWRKLPTARRRLFARHVLAMPFLQAATGLLIPISVALALFAEAPVGVVLITLLPLAPTLVTLVAEAAGLDEFGRLYDRKIRIRDYVRLILGAFPYQALLAAAAVRAVHRHVRGENSRARTGHTGAHRTGSAAVEESHEPVSARDRPADSRHTVGASS